MASGIKGLLKPGAGNLDLTATYKLVEATTTTTVIVSACNQTASADNIRIALIPAGTTATSGSASTNNYIEFDYPLAANSALERTGIVLETNARIMVSSAAGSTSFACYGLES